MGRKMLAHLGFKNSKKKNCKNAWNFAYFGLQFRCFLAFFCPHSPHPPHCNNVSNWTFWYLKGGWSVIHCGLMNFRVWLHIWIEFLSFPKAIYAPWGMWEWLARFEEIWKEGISQTHSSSDLGPTSGLTLAVHSFIHLLWVPVRTSHIYPKVSAPLSWCWSPVVTRHMQCRCAPLSWSRSLSAANSWRTPAMRTLAHVDLLMSIVDF